MTALLMLVLVFVVAAALVQTLGKRQEVRIPLYIHRRTTRRRRL
jgi:hypothetical protein